MKNKKKKLRIKRIKKNLKMIKKSRKIEKTQNELDNTNYILSRLNEIVCQVKSLEKSHEINKGISDLSVMMLIIKIIAFWIFNVMKVKKQVDTDTSWNARKRARNN